MQTNISNMGCAENKESPSKLRQRLYSDQNVITNDFSEMPIIDLDVYLKAIRTGNNPSDFSDEVRLECQKVTECFHHFGILLIRDPRVDMEHNEEYIDLMEEYFEKTGELFYSGEKVDDIKAEWMYQVGATPEKIEMARDHSDLIQNLNFTAENMPESPLKPILDAKWRYMWKIGERPEGAADDFPQVIPRDFPDWEEKMNKWGLKMNQAIFTLAEMAALGMGVERETFTKRM